jgi:hypothetical protein
MATARRRYIHPLRVYAWQPCITRSTPILFIGGRAMTRSTLTVYCNSLNSSSVPLLAIYTYKLLSDMKTLCHFELPVTYTW